MTFSEIQDICDAYIAKAEKLESERKIGDGLFGMGSKPADDPCHERFAKDMEKALKETASGSPSSSDVYELLGYIYRLPKEHQDPLSIYWMLNAIHGLTLPLIKLLERGDAKRLCEQYSSDYRRFERLPVQEKVYKALKAGSR